MAEDKDDKVKAVTEIKKIKGKADEIIRSLSNATGPELSAKHATLQSLLISAMNYANNPEVAGIAQALAEVIQKGIKTAESKQEAEAQKAVTKELNQKSVDVDKQQIALQEFKEVFEKEIKLKQTELAKATQELTKIKEQNQEVAAKLKKSEYDTYLGEEQRAAEQKKAQLEQQIKSAENAINFGGKSPEKQQIVDEGRKNKGIEREGNKAHQEAYEKQESYEFEGLYAEPAEQSSAAKNSDRAARRAQRGTDPQKQSEKKKHVPKSPARNGIEDNKDLMREVKEIRETMNRATKNNPSPPQNTSVKKDQGQSR